DSTSIIVYDPLGITESVIDPVNLFPNPGTDKFTLIGSDIQSVQIHNISGELIRKLDTKNRTRLDFNLGDQAKGVYFIRIVNSEVEITKLLILM
ncbi:MAG: T9SS type A sorting domain-containing protein, partial [Bacteroidales bacterium]|nr:T9SS type A sorting domain-containing protein [Bacteroidales bacterium]